MNELAWVAETASECEALGFDPEGRVTFDDGPFVGFLERVPLRPGMALYRVEGTSSHAWTLKAQGDAPAGNLVFGTMLSGAGAIVAEGNERQVWHSPGRPFVVSLAEREIAYHLEPGEPWRAVTLLLEAEALERLAAEDGLPPLARAVLKDGRLPVSHVLESDRAVTRAASDLMCPAYRGTMATLWRESKALELLAHQLDHLAGSPPAPVTLSARDLARVREAHHLLVADLRTPPSLEALAAQAKLPSRRLNQGFRQLHGMSVFEVLLEARMKMAHALVLERQDIALKHLAWMVGYSQLSNFINAYRRRFGVPPGRHRREGGSD
ncbi:MAG: AraC family transcriptional regulator [Alphaproteobacteria bacterium]|nr:helix-turn-helix transcriptional regulator [Rhizobiaceae bacterium]MBU3959230.1 AraC family transcriptional regulator [Alphaproteobacteria bacterium]MBU4048078.1 AraC family transcriptional regulator [Alphaproteobacteria bacterium]MBU4087351.1 AraC family transcriptional regulator [Alphaproteobacteria bacterium]MBU4159013.1 AraC family transcriptional regulator [Alphaproteobacteria bacterium]